jgi:MoaA/NifB/PqqE/SkfB family radical SAM enzyme
MDNWKSYKKNLWILTSPVVLTRVMRGFARALLLGKSTLKTIEIFPTLQCNLRCEMCSVAKYHRNEKTGTVLGLEDYERIARQGAMEGAIAVSILGGEPLMSPILKDILAIFKKYRYTTYMVSNGSLLDFSKVQDLKRWGLDLLSMSLESLDVESHQKRRGSHQLGNKILDNIRLCKEGGLPVGLSTVFFPGKVEEAEEVIAYASRNGIGISAGQVCPIGGWEGKPVLSRSENEKIRKILKRYPRLTMDWAMTYHLRHRCVAGKEKIAITSTGEVLGCSVNPISFGNIREENLSKILSRLRSFRPFREWFPGCLAAESKEYIERYLEPLSQYKNHPVSWLEHPSVSAALLEITK